MNKLIIVSFLIFTSISYGQIKCDDLIKTVRGLKKIYTGTTNESSWLQNIDFYEYHDKPKRKREFYAVAKIKNKDYVFCKMPFANQLGFLAKRNMGLLTSGEAFHEYIFDYKCDCN